MKFEVVNQMKFEIDGTLLGVIVFFVLVAVTSMYAMYKYCEWCKNKP